MTSTTPGSTERPTSTREVDDLPHRDYTVWVQTAIVLALVGYTVAGAMLFLLQDRIPTTEPVMVLACIVGLVLVQRGRVQAASLLVITAVWLELMQAILFRGGVQGYVGLPVFPVFVVVVGMLLGGGGAYGAALLTSVGVPLAIAGHALLPGAEPVDVRGEIYFVAVLVIACLITAIVVDRGLATFRWHVAQQQRERRRFAELFLNAPDGMILLGSDARVEAVNPFAVDLFGLDSGQLVGRAWQELPFRRAINGSANGVESLLAEAERAPRAIRIERPDGSVVSAEVTARAVPHEGDGPGRLLVVRDVSERVAMAERVAQLGEIIQQTEGEIYVVSVEPRSFLFVSRGACDNLGYTVEELRALPVSSVIPEFPADLVHGLSNGDADGTTASTFRTVHRRRDGSAYPAEHRIQAGRLGDRWILIIFAIDVTDREQAEAESALLRERLQQAQKLDAVGLLAGGVAHDFNNLLTIIGGSAELIEMTAGDENRALAGEIIRAHKQGALLTRRLLAFARQELVQPSVLSVPETIHEARPLVDALLGERIDLELSSDGSGSIVADAGQVEQVLLNLAANARDAMPEGGRLRIDTDVGGTRPGYLHVSVRDTGAGMDEEVIQRAFEPFYTTKPRGKGTGLGLSTVHGIVSQNQGTVEIESRPGEGTRVSVFWPLASGHGQADAAGATGVPVEEGAGTILVAEDNDGTRRVVSLHLKRAGYEVISAADGEEALRFLTGGLRPDLLLTDVVMPGMSGIDLAERVKNAWPDLPVILMSGYMEGHKSLEGIEEERVLLQKPIQWDEMIECVRDAIARSGTD